MKMKIALVLGSGGSKGLAHIGVIKAVLEKGYQIEEIVGTSAGALMGGWYASCQDISIMENFANSISYKYLLKILTDWPDNKGVIRGRKIEMFLEKIFENKLIENLPIKFRAVSANLVTGEKCIFEKGSLSTAVRASISIPAIFSPVKFDSKILIDGGAIEPLPVAEVKRKKDVKIVAVGLYKNIFPKNYDDLSKSNIVKITYSSMQQMLVELSRRDMEKADIKILPPVADINVLNFVKAKEYIKIGYDTAMKAFKDF